MGAGRRVTAGRAAGWTGLPAPLALMIAAVGGPDREACVKFKKGDTIIYPQHGACIVMGTKKMEAFGEKKEYLILQTVINEMTLKVPVDMAEEVGVRPPVSADELEDLVAVLSKPDPRSPSIPYAMIRRTTSPTSRIARIGKPRASREGSWIDVSRPGAPVPEAVMGSLLTQR